MRGDWGPLLFSFFLVIFCPRCSRDLQILRPVRPRVRDLLNTKQRTRVSQRHSGGKTWQLSSFYYGFSHECRGGENKISNVKSLIILQSGERVTSFTKLTKLTKLTFLVKNGKMKLLGNSIKKTRKNFKSNLVLVVVLVLESNALQYLNVWNRLRWYQRLFPKEYEKFNVKRNESGS